MAMNYKYTEQVKPLGLVLNTSAAAAAEVSLGSFVDVRGYHRILAVGLAEDIPSGVTLTVQLQAASDAAGSDAEDFGTAKTVTASGGATRDVLAVQEEFESELPAGKYYVNAIVSHDDDSGSHDVSVIILGGEAMMKPVTDGDEFGEVATTTTAPTTTTAAPTTTTTEQA